MSDQGVFRPGGITYLRIPAPAAAQLAGFYAAVFGWKVDAERASPSFEDAGGFVIGHFHSDEAVAGEAGVRPYVYVNDVAATLEKVIAEGGTVATPIYPEGDLLVATFHDPAGNVMGVWQRAGGG